MYCVIQEVSIKSIPKGEPKAIEVEESRWIMNGESYCSYGYRYSNDYFERPVKKSFRISIHESFRENGKVRKKQTVICTIGYYDIVDFGSWVGDYITGSRWNEKLKAIGLPENDLVEMIYKKFQPIIDRVEAEFQQTDEYRAREAHREIFREHEQRIEAFTEKYSVSREEYSRCYDIFGELRNPEYLKKIKAAYKARKEYERRSRQQSRSYYENFHSNYSGGRNNGYCGNHVNTYSEEDKAMLKKFYRTLSKVFHPDSNPGKDTLAEMKMLNQIKNEWGI